jgi:hypothetical protein
VALSENGIIEIPYGVAWLIADGKPAAWGPLIAAVYIAFCKCVMRDLLNSMIRVKSSLRWYLAALLLIPAIVGGAQMIAQFLGAELPVSEALQNPLTLPIAFVWIFFSGRAAARRGRLAGYIHANAANQAWRTWGKSGNRLDVGALAFAIVLHAARGNLL